MRRNGLRGGLLFLLIVMASESYAQFTPEVGVFGDYSYFYDFKSNYGYGIDCRLVTDRGHKLALSVSRWAADVDLYDPYLDYRAASESPGNYVYSNADVEIGHMDGWCFEIAPMFRVNKGDLVKNFIGIGVGFITLSVRNNGTLSVYEYNNFGDLVFTGNYPYSFVERGNAPGIRFLFETDWAILPQLSAAMNVSLRYAKIENMKIGSRMGSADYFEPQTYSLGGFYLKVGLTYKLDKTIGGK